MNLDFEKNNGLLPVIVQHALSSAVLMLGYMNAAALEKTLNEKIVTFYSRSRQCLWTKGSTSGNYLRLVEMSPDCDGDTLLVKAIPTGPVCHTGAATCFGAEGSKGFLYRLEDIIAERIAGAEAHSYTSKLFRSGINKMAQKVGEEAVELVIEAKDNKTDLFSNEAADLLFHFLLLLQAKGLRLENIEAVLQERQR